jgi:hypothetical protein
VRDDSHNLTRRELEIARLIERGFSNGFFHDAPTHTHAAAD